MHRLHFATFKSTGSANYIALDVLTVRRLRAATVPTEPPVARQTNLKIRR